MICPYFPCGGFPSHGGTPKSFYVWIFHEINHRAIGLRGAGLQPAEVYLSLQPWLRHPSNRKWMAYRMGLPVDSVQLPKKSGFVVDITIVFMGVIMVYKPTYNWGAHPVTPVFSSGMRRLNPLLRGL